MPTRAFKFLPEKGSVSAMLLQSELAVETSLGHMRVFLAWLHARNHMAKQHISETKVNQVAADYKEDGLKSKSHMSSKSAGRFLVTVAQH